MIDIEHKLTLREVIDLIQPYFDEELRKRSASYVSRYYRMERFMEELYAEGIDQRSVVRRIVEEVFRDGVICGRREIFGGGEERP